MLTENEVIKILAEHLENQGDTILQALNTDQRGIDLIAKRGAETLYVEAKGETSSKQSKRESKAFTKSQIKSHVGQALLAALRVVSNKQYEANWVSAIALPNNKGHLSQIEQIMPSLKQIGIKVYLINDKGVIEP